jgi:hypothetical protein
MPKEFEFFITEDDPQVKAWAEKKKQDGGILVRNARGLIAELEKLTQQNDEVICRISGAWLEVCVEKSVRRLLHPVGYGHELVNREIIGVMVDLRTCVAWGDRDLSVGDKRHMLTGKLGDIAADPRLTLLP